MQHYVFTLFAVVMSSVPVIVQLVCVWYNYFMISSPEYTVHTSITHVITTLEW